MYRKGRLQQLNKITHNARPQVKRTSENERRA